MTRLRASFPYVHGSIAAIARPPEANNSGACTAPASWKSGNVMVISRIVSVDELNLPKTFVSPLVVIALTGMPVSLPIPDLLEARR